MNIPEGIEAINVEGGDLRKAITAAAEQLELKPNQVDYKLDLSHFRSTTGVSVSKSTVKIFAWNSGREEGVEPPPVKKARSGGERSSDRGRDDRRDSRRDDRRDNRRRDDRRDDRRRDDRRRDDRRRDDRRRDDRRDDGPPRLRGPEEGTTDASDWASAWFSTVLEHMGLEGEVVGTGSDERVHLHVKVDKAGRLIGKRGATLGAIRHILTLGIEAKFGERAVDVDVADDRNRGGDGGRGRGDRDERGRGRDRDRGGRGRRGPRRGERSGKYPEEKLQALARRAADKAMESGKTVTIKLDLNSYDRRVIHVEVAEIEGVESQSEERTVTDDEGIEGVIKYIQIIPASPAD